MVESFVPSRRALVVVLATMFAASVVPTGCGAASFVCDGDESCRDGGRDGQCEANGSCSFPDAGCPSGRRYGEHGMSKAGECVSDDASDTQATSSADTMTTTNPTTDDPTTIEPTTTNPTTSPDPGTTTTGADATDAGTEPTPTDPYGRCEQDEDCPDGFCEALGALPLTCAPPCNNAAECPDSSAAATSPACVGTGGEKWCVLPCQGPPDCPPMMECSSWEEAEYGRLCTWF